MHEFARNAVAPATQRTYRSAQKQYQLFCAAQEPAWDGSMAALTAPAVAEFCAALGMGGRVASGTLKTYLSGLAAGWKATLTEGASPFAHPALQRVIDGVCRHLDDCTRARGPAASHTSELTSELLMQLAPWYNARAADDPTACMHWAAATVALYSCLRPSELLGSAEHPDRALCVADIVFYSHPRSDAIQRWRDLPLVRVPDRFTIKLGQTKTDQAGTSAPYPCAVPAAVAALWKWCLMRQRLGEKSPLLFYLNGTPLRMRTLLDSLEIAHEQQGLGDISFTGKCFRRGGTSSAAASGMAIPDMMARGRWKSPAMPAVYTSGHAALARKLWLDRLVPIRPEECSWDC